MYVCTLTIYKSLRRYRLHLSSLNSSENLSLHLQNTISIPKFDALSNGKLLFSLYAVSHANISIFHMKFQLIDLKVKEYVIFCANL